LDADEENSVSVGFNFRYANYYYLPEGDAFTQYRDLYKVYGVRFLFLLNGQGGKFDIVPLLGIDEVYIMGNELLVNIGSGLALLAIATLISDIITLHILPQRKFYNKVKYETVETPSQRYVPRYLELLIIQTCRIVSSKRRRGKSRENSIIGCSQILINIYEKIPRIFIIYIRKDVPISLLQ
jgi:hypothetical protein